MKQTYYDTFSRFYDRFVALHSRDTQGQTRKFLADQLPVQTGGSVLDVCTGTAALLSYLQTRVGREGQVVGVDFSCGMLKMGREKDQRFGFYNFRHSLATFLINKGKDVKTIQGLLRHAKASTTLDLYSQAMDEFKLAAQREIALAITSNQTQAN